MRHANLSVIGRRREIMAEHPTIVYSKLHAYARRLDLRRCLSNRPVDLEESVFHSALCSNINICFAVHRALSMSIQGAAA